MTKKIIPSIILYTFAGLLLIYAIWAFIHCVDIISQAKAAGQLAASGNEYDIMSFYMGSCAGYVVYALLLAATGLILQKKAPVAEAPVVPDQRHKNNEADDELDELFDRADSEESIE